MKSTQKKLVLCRQEDWLNSFRYNLEPQGDGLRLDVRQHTAGFLCLHSLDSGTPGFSWKRVRVDCRLPDGSTLRVYAHASDHKAWGQWQDLDEALPHLSGEEGLRVLRPAFQETIRRSGDLLVSRSGRYLWLLLELMSSSQEPPEIHGLSVWMDGDHMTDYLPAIYQGDDFTYRFLSVFNSMLLDMEEQICDLPGRLDSGYTDEEMLRYLASWVCLDSEQVSEEDLRRWIPTTLDDYEKMYTVEGIRQSVRRLTGQEPMLIEHSQVDPNHRSCLDPTLYRRLYGDDPFQFFVLLQENTFADRDAIEDFLDRMQQRIPAGTRLGLILLKKCIQLDWHTYLGVNSVVGGYVPVAFDENTTIHFDTMIGG